MSKEKEIRHIVQLSTTLERSSTPLSTAGEEHRSTPRRCKIVLVGFAMLEGKRPPLVYKAVSSTHTGLSFDFDSAASSAVDTYVFFSRHKK